MQYIAVVYLLQNKFYIITCQREDIFQGVFCLCFFFTFFIPQKQQLILHLKICSLFVTVFFGLFTKFLDGICSCRFLPNKVNLFKKLFSRCKQHKYSNYPVHFLCHRSPILFFFLILVVYNFLDSFDQIIF